MCVIRVIYYIHFLIGVSFVNISAKGRFAIYVALFGLRRCSAPLSGKKWLLLIRISLIDSGRGARERERERLARIYIYVREGGIRSRQKVSNERGLSPRSN